MSSYAFFVQTCREEHKKKHPDASVNFSEFSKKCSERWKVRGLKTYWEGNKGWIPNWDFFFLFSLGTICIMWVLMLEQVTKYLAKDTDFVHFHTSQLVKILTDLSLQNFFYRPCLLKRKENLKTWQRRTRPVMKEKWKLISLLKGKQKSSRIPMHPRGLRKYLACFDFSRKNLSTIL